MVSLLATSRSLSSGWDRGTVELYCTCMLPYSTFPYRRQLACLPEYSLTYFRTYYSLIHRLSLSPSLPPSLCILSRHYFAVQPALVFCYVVVLLYDSLPLYYCTFYGTCCTPNPIQPNPQPTTHLPPTERLQRLRVQSSTVLSLIIACSLVLISYRIALHISLPRAWSSRQPGGLWVVGLVGASVGLSASKMASGSTYSSVRVYF